jgi:7-carboxy-7-deazaguanine synthase
VTYRVKELFFTLQGEGAHVGRPAVFCRFSGCNLWTGREDHRASAICRFCDTDFVGTDGPGGGRYDTNQLVDAVIAAWNNPCVSPFLVCTGGEPLLQLDEELVGALKSKSIEIAIETNGTLLPPSGIDWICVSPKVGADLVLRSGDELKFVFPQGGVDPSEFDDCDFTHRFLQPMDGPDRVSNTDSAIAYCMTHPHWRLSLQTHKYLGIP